MLSGRPPASGTGASRSRNPTATIAATIPRVNDERGELGDRLAVVGRLAEDPVRELGDDEREAEQVELVRGIGALDRRADHESPGTKRRRTVATAAAARRVVKLETAIDSEA